jgi:hypothetical protein
LRGPISAYSPLGPGLLSTGANPADDFANTTTLCSNWPTGITSTFHFMALYLNDNSNVAATAEAQVDVQ